MLHEYMGADAFRDGLRHYLDVPKYGNTVTEDLWKALGETSGQPIARIMNSWVKQKNYPVVHVERLDRDASGAVTHAVSYTHLTLPTIYSV